MLLTSTKTNKQKTSRHQHITIILQSSKIKQ
jgi:hypothetical protein